MARAVGGGVKSRIRGVGISIKEAPRKIIGKFKRQKAEAELEKRLEGEEVREGKVEYRRKKRYIVWFSHGGGEDGKPYNIRREIAVYGWEKEGDKIDLTGYLEKAVGLIFNGTWKLSDIEDIQNSSKVQTSYEATASTGQTSDSDDGLIEYKYTLRRNFGRGNTESLVHETMDK